MKNDANLLDNLQNSLNYSFNNLDILILSLTHKSFAYENNIKNNERLEFLGDTILQLVITEYLVKNYPDLSEGLLSKFRAVLVSETNLVIVAKKIDLGKYLLIGKGEESTNGREKKSILADTFEAVVAAVYLDSNKKHAVEIIEKVIIDLFLESIKSSENDFSKADFKTVLQEYVQKNKIGDLRYDVVEINGPDHKKEFTSSVFIDDQNFGTGKAKIKKVLSKMRPLML